MANKYSTEQRKRIKKHIGLKKPNKFLYKEVISIFEDTKDMARDIYNLMFTKGWYTITPEEDTKIENWAKDIEYPVYVYKKYNG